MAREAEKETRLMEEELSGDDRMWDIVTGGLQCQGNLGKRHRDDIILFPSPATQLDSIEDGDLRPRYQTPES